MFSKKVAFLFVAILLVLFACKKTQKNVPVGECGIVSYDGFDYHTVKIANQCWLQENLRNTHFNDGTPITEAEDSLTWASDSTGAWCIYQRDSNATVQQMIDTEAYFGKLYSIKAATNARMCPNGWHMPTIDEWKELTDNYIESGNALRMVDGHWANGGPYATPSNISNFSALPGGARGPNGFFHLIDSDAYFWSNSPNALPMHIHFNSKFAEVNPAGVGPYRAGFSCRCVQDR